MTVLRHDSTSCLDHALGTANLALDLLARPPGSFDGTLLELAVRPSFLNHGCNPVLAEDLGQLAVGISIGKITRESLVFCPTVPFQSSMLTYPMTPMAARMRASLRLGS